MGEEKGGTYTDKTHPVTCSPTFKQSSGSPFMDLHSKNAWFSVVHELPITLLAASSAVDVTSWWWVAILSGLWWG